MNMIIGGSRKNKNKNNDNQQSKKNNKASILARKRERWKLQKEVHEEAQKFQGPGHSLQGITRNSEFQDPHHNNSNNESQYDYNQTLPSSNKRPFLLPGRLESASPPKTSSYNDRDYNNNNNNNNNNCKYYNNNRQHHHYNNNNNNNRNNTRNYERTNSTIGLNEDVLTKLTERIATRLRVELRNEVEDFTKYDEGAKRDVTNKIESFLQNELQQHTCPVCFEPMLPPNKSPMLLFPCGHTFCDECIKKQKKIATHKCPFCRAKIEKVAINHSLKQLMETFLKKKDAIESGESSVSKAFQSNSSNNNSNNKITKNRYNNNNSNTGNPNQSKAAEYMQKCRALKIRGKIMKNELEDTKNNLSRLDQQKSSCSLVMKTLRKEEAKAIERLEAAKEALALVREHVAEQKEKFDAIDKEKLECHQKIKLIESTVATIDRDADKAYILLQNFSPGAEVVM